MAHQERDFLQTPGREGGVHSLDFYSELTNVCVDLS